MSHVRLVLAAFVLSLASMAFQVEARAQNLSPWPYSESCNTGSGACFAITNSSSVANSYGIFGASSSGMGVVGESTSNSGVYGSSSSWYGVGGASSSGSGIYGFSSTGNGVLAVNNDTTGAAAAVSAGARQLLWAGLLGERQHISHGEHSVEGRRWILDGDFRQARQKRCKGL
jgi:hypothetical protein